MADSDPDPSAGDSDEVIRRKAKRSAARNAAGKAPPKSKRATKAPAAKKPAARKRPPAKRHAAAEKNPAAAVAEDTPGPASEPSLAERVAALERRGRRLAWTAAALAAGMVALAVYARPGTTPGASAGAPAGPPAPEAPAPEAEGPAPEAEGPADEDVVDAEPEAARDQIELLAGRLKLIDLGDQAISKGSRFAYRELERRFKQPEVAALKDAANAELIRVESHYATTRRFRGYALPLKKLFPRVADERDLDVEELGSIIRAEGLPWEARARAAQLMAQHRTARAAKFLIGAMETDPNLAVIQEAILSFGEVTGFRSDAVLNPDGAIGWWKANRERLEARES